MLMQWGLVPATARNFDQAFHTINARAETLEKKWMFRPLLEGNRCLVIANGFYEWARRRGEGRKQAFYFTRKDGKLMCMAGLYDVWESETGERKYTYTICTQDAPDLIKDSVHPRVPCVLKDSAFDVWLDCEHNNVQAALDTLRGQSQPDVLNWEEDVVWYPVSLKVNSSRNDGPDLTQPAPNSDPRLSSPEQPAVKKARIIEKSFEPAVLPQHTGNRPPLQDEHKHPHGGSNSGSSGNNNPTGRSSHTEDSLELELNVPYPDPPAAAQSGNARNDAHSSHESTNDHLNVSSSQAADSQASPHRVLVLDAESVKAFIQSQ